MIQLRKADRQRLADFSENWKDIPGLGGYAAYWRGAIINKATNRVLTNTVYKNGYVYVCVKVNGVYKNFRLHRLIASAYLPNPLNKPEVNHKWGNKEDNHVSSLEWATSSENKKHAFASGLMKPSKPQLGKMNELSCRSIPIIQTTIDGVIINNWPSISEAGRNGFQPSLINKVLKGERPHHKGFIWKYSKI